MSIGTTVGLIAIAVVLVTALVVWLFVRRDFKGWLAALMTAVVGLAVVGATWFTFGFLISTYQKDNCERIAQGYGLDDSEWSFRNGCRLRLETGQLVPEGRIRILENGQIVVTGDD